MIHSQSNLGLVTSRIWNGSQVVNDARCVASLVGLMVRRDGKDIPAVVTGADVE